MASTARRYDSATQQYVDSGTLWVDVECWGSLSGNVAASTRSPVEPTMSGGRGLSTSIRSLSSPFSSAVTAWLGARGPEGPLLAIVARALAADAGADIDYVVPDETILIETPADVELQPLAQPEAPATAANSVTNRFLGVLFIVHS